MPTPGLPARRHHSQWKFHHPADPVRHRDGERLQGTQQFLPTPRDETWWLFNPQFRGFRNLLARLLQPLTMDVANLAGTNQLLGC